MQIGYYCSGMSDWMEMKEQYQRGCGEQCLVKSFLHLELFIYCHIRQKT